MKTADDSAIGVLIKKNEKLVKELTALEKMALWFMYAKYCVPSESVFFWAPYIAALPEIEDLNHVLLMTEEEVSILKGSFAYETMTEIRERSSHVYALLKKEIFSDEGIEELTECKSLSENAWNWAMATVLGRSERFVDLAIKNEEDRVAFPVVIPYFDFIGYYPTAGGLFGRTKEGVYHAELEYKENREVFRAASSDCGAMVFVRYGLYLQDSPYACSTLPTTFMNFAPPASSPELKAKREAAFKRLDEAGMNKNTFHIFESTITEELLLRSEMVNMNMEEYNAIDSDDEEEREKHTFETRMKAFRWLAESIRSYVAEAFPTTVEQDDKRLDSDRSLSKRARLALQVIHDEKETLLSFVDEIESHMNPQTSNNDKNNEGPKQEL